MKIYDTGLILVVLFGLIKAGIDAQTVSVNHTEISAFAIGCGDRAWVVKWLPKSKLE